MIIVDSSYASLDEALRGIEFPQDIRDTLIMLNVRYISFDRMLHQGQVVVHKNLASEILDLFRDMFKMRFPIGKVVPVARYGWDDDVSIAANNSSAFNYRYIAGTKRLSLHSLGVALDLNPMLNPCFGRDGSIAPPEGIYNPDVPGTLYDGGPVVELFLRRGWEWGGHWTSLKDYQHLQKPQ